MSKSLIPTAKIEESITTDGKSRIIVLATWSGVDRPNGCGISCGSNMKLAGRLARAIEAGAVYPNPRIAKDVNGRTYVTHGCCVMGRHLNADLKRLGF